jgi:hypothetical protein
MIAVLGSTPARLCPDLARGGAEARRAERWMIYPPDRRSR